MAAFFILLIVTWPTEPLLSYIRRIYCTLMYVERCGRTWPDIWRGRHVLPRLIFRRHIFPPLGDPRLVDCIPARIERGGSVPALEPLGLSGPVIVLELAIQRRAGHIGRSLKRLTKSQVSFRSPLGGFSVHRRLPIRT